MLKNIIKISMGMAVIFTAGCQSLPKDLSSLSAMGLAKQKYSVPLITVNKSFKGIRGKFFRSSYIKQESITVQLPGAEGIFLDYISHCESIGGSPRFVKSITLICTKGGSNLYAVNAFEGRRDAWMQVVEPLDLNLKEDPEIFASYAFNGFKGYVQRDLKDTLRLLGDRTLHENFPEYF